MAVVTITIIEGRDRETKNRLMRKLTDAVVETLDAKPGQVRVIINEVRNGDYAVAGDPVLVDEPHGHHEIHVRRGDECPPCRKTNENIVHRQIETDVEKLTEFLAGLEVD